MNKGFLAAALAALVIGVIVYNWRGNATVKLRLVNVLDQKYFDDAHIKGAKNVESVCVPFAKLESMVKNWDKTVPVVTYCADYRCTASGSAAKKLTELGFTDVWAYEGGTAEWHQLGQTDSAYKIEGPAQEGYLRSSAKKSTEHEAGVREITASELQKKIKEATL